MSRTHRRLCAVGLVAAVVGAAAVAPAQASPAQTATTLYVNNMAPTCTDSGTGTAAAPFCSLQDAANAATAGDTVSVADSPGHWYPGSSYGNPTIANSGTASAPITFVATGTTYASIGSLAVTGSYIHISGFSSTITGGPVYTVDGSHVAFDHDSAATDNAPILELGPDASSVTVEQSFLWSSYAAENTASEVVRTSPGDNGFVLADDEIYDLAGNSVPSNSPVVSLDGTQNTEITSNTITASCDSAVALVGAEATSIENNVIGTIGTCASGTPADLMVDSASAASTTADYNELSQMGSGVDPYSWAGSVYPSRSAFTAATGQGAHDEVEPTIDLATNTEPTGDGVADGNASAPGELATDIYGNTWPGAAPDRGAVAAEDFTAATLYASTMTAQEAGITLALKGAAWGSSASYSVSWGDGQTDADQPLRDLYPLDFSAVNATHMYARPGTYTITVTAEDAAQTVTRTATVTTTGSTFVPQTPTRILDTRYGTGVAKGAVGPNGTISVGVTDGVTGAPAIGTITAVVMNVTTTESTAAGYVTVYPHGTTLPGSSNLNYAKNQTVPNLVTVKVGADGEVSLHNASSGSTDLIADVEGYYVEGGSGSGYLANSPQRLLDTRVGTGAPKAAVGPGATVSLTIPSCPATSGGTTTAPATAVALNVTATDPTAAGYVTVYPGGAATVPTASDVNYAAGQTVPNLVVVKVGADGKVDFHNDSTGRVQLVGDLEGCYTASTGDAFVPLNPTRALDTRSGVGQGTATGTAVAPWSAADWNVPDAPLDELWDSSALVLNVTVTDATKSGFITAFPYGSPGSAVPDASNLNFAAGQTVPNLVMVASRAFPQVALYNNSAGTTQLIADLFGYFS